jgi:plastocyanin
MKRFVRFGIFSLTLVLALATAGCGSDSKNPVNPPPTLELNSGTLTSGQQYVHKFNTAGAYNYFCQVHGNSMSGSVTVDPASAVATLSISIVDNAFSPSTTTVDTGATVTWTNNGSNNHTVTSK